MLSTIISDILEVRTEEVFIGDISLLTEEQHERYRSVLDSFTVNTRWWINTPAETEDVRVKYVSADNFVIHSGRPCTESLGVRPVISLVDPIKLFHLSEEPVKRVEPGDLICIKDTTWAVLNDDLAISEDIIGRVPFSKDMSSIKYEDSDIRKYLSDWFEHQELRTFQYEISKSIGVPYTGLAM